MYNRSAATILDIAAGTTERRLCGARWCPALARVLAEGARESLERRGNCSYMDVVKRKLSREYWAGRRWLAYDTLRSAGWLNRLRCFTNYSSAAAYCKENSGINGIFRIRALVEVLAVLNGIRPDEPTSADREILAKLLATRPLTGYRRTISPLLGLLRQKYFPVFWNSRIDPLSAVGVYHIIRRRVNSGQQRAIRLLGSYGEFKEAVGSFASVVRRIHELDVELMLAGQVNGAALNLVQTWSAPETGIIVFYRSVAEISGQSGKLVVDIEPVHDIDRTILIRTPLFASYNRHHRMILFYDGYLRRVQPGEVQTFVDFAYFDFDWKSIFIS
jgi:hypothetical protein